MTSAPVLRLPNFSTTFYLETDASDFGVGAVLLQDGHPIAFFSKKLGPRRRVTSTYHKELYAIVEAVQKWRQYLLGREFVIRSDQKSLKELLQQVIQTPDQQLFIRKLMGYKFRIEYKTGASNKAADALSRRDEEIVDIDTHGRLLTALCHPIPEILEILRDENRTSEELLALHSAVTSGTASGRFSVTDGLLYFDRRLVVAQASVAKEALLYEHHSTPMAGHPGVDRTFRRLAASFFWRNMRKDVKRFVDACFECQTTKYSTQRPAGLLQPLPIPSQVWEDVSMDFITSLPQSRGYTTILVAVDRLSKYAHFAPLPARFDAWRVANLFVDTVVKHHCFPRTLVSDRDLLFLSEVWAHMLKLSGTKQHFTTAYHPQSDGQTEVRNRGVEQYLRTFVADRPAKWANFLPWAELALNCFYHEGLGTSPFHALYGRDPPALIAAAPSASTPPDVARDIRERGELLVTLRRNLEKAQARMRTAANRHRRHLEFNVGDRVLLKLQQYRQHSVARPVSAKLGRRFYGPFEVLERIGEVAYKLKLPEGSRIHNVFHVSLLRPFVEGVMADLPAFPSVFARGFPIARPTRLRARRTVLCDNVPREEGLLEWSDDGGVSPTWEPISVIERHFPTLLADKELVNGGGVDTDIASTPNDGPPAEESEASIPNDGPPIEESEAGELLTEECVAGDETFQTTEEETPAVELPATSGRPRRQPKPIVRYGDFVSR